MNALGCDEFRDLAPDLALGIVAGDERAAALTHVAGCDPCRRHLDGLAQVADELLLLAPSVEPEVGFESRVVARLRAGGAFPHPVPEVFDAPARSRPFRPSPPSPPSRPSPPPRSRWRPARAILIAVAAVSILVAGLGGVVAGLAKGRREGSTQSTQSAGARQLAARTVVIRADGGRSTCQLVAFPAAGGQPARLVIVLDEAAQAPESYQVVAEPAGGGASVLVGTIAMANGHGVLVASLPAGAGPVDGVRIMDSPNTVRYHATFQSV